MPVHNVIRGTTPGSDATEVKNSELWVAPALPQYTPTALEAFVTAAAKDVNRDRASTLEGEGHEGAVTTKCAWCS